MGDAARPPCRRHPGEETDGHQHRGDRAEGGKHEEEAGRPLEAPRLRVTGQQLEEQRDEAEGDRKVDDRRVERVGQEAHEYPHSRMLECTLG